MCFFCTLRNIEDSILRKRRENTFINFEGILNLGNHFLQFSAI